MAKRQKPTETEFIADMKSEIPSDVDLGRVASLAQNQLKLEDELAEAETRVKQLKSQLAFVSTDLLPTAMSELGLSEFSLSDGSKITIAPFVSAHISQQNKENAFLWLAEHGFGDIVKNQVVLTFGRQEMTRARSAMSVLQEHGYEPENKQSVHGQTLKAWVKERLAEGDEIPFDLFGVYSGQITKIRRG